MEQISIETALDKLNDTVDIHDSTVKTFGLRFLNHDGEKREIIARKYTKSPKQKVTEKDKRGQDFYNLQRNGILLLLDVLSEHPRSIKLAMIYGFKDYQSDNWLNVFH